MKARLLSPLLRAFLFPLVTPPPVILARQVLAFLFMNLEMKEDWHLDKGLSVSHLIATIMLVMGGISAYFGVTERLAVLENQFVQLSDRVVRVLESQQRVDDAQDRDLVSFRNEIRADIRSINDKLDRLMEIRLSGQ